MRDINIVTLVGRVTRDPELKYTPTGTELVNCSIAVNDDFTDKNGEKKEKVSFFDLTVWGKLAEIFQKYVKKGQQIAISGKLEQQRWEKDGEKKSKISITVDKMQMVGSKKKEESEPDTGGGSVDTAGKGDNPFSDDNIPF